MRFLKILAASIGALVLVAIAVYWFACPCSVVPGGALAGTVGAGTPDDWSFANDVPLCQLQVATLIPYSVNVNCMASADGDLFVSCSRCDGKFWSSRATADPKARIRMGRSVYPVTLTRLMEPDRLDVAWRARVSKLGLEPDTPRPDHWWSFQAVSRSPRD